METEAPEEQAVEQEKIEQVEEAKDTLPVVTAPDEEGYFPLIKRQLWEEQVLGNSGPDDELPQEELSVNFAEDEEFQHWLAEKYPNISDWSLYGQTGYYLKKDLYDPYSYQWRMQYLPYRFYVLSTEQSSEFDHLAVGIHDFVETMEYTDTSIGVSGVWPQKITLFYSLTGSEEQWQLGKEQDVHFVHFEDNESITLWLPQTERALLFHFNYEISEQDKTGENVQFISNAKTEPPIYVSGQYLKAQHGEGNSLWDVKTKEGDFRGYYRGVDECFYLFEETYNGNALIDLTGAWDCLLLHEGKMTFHNFLNDDPTDTVWTLGGEGQGLSEEPVILYWNSLIWDESDWSKYTVAYRTEKDNCWSIVYFNLDGTVLSRVHTSLETSSEQLFIHQTLMDGVLTMETGNGVYSLDLMTGEEYSGTSLQQ